MHESEDDRYALIVAGGDAIRLVPGAAGVFRELSESGTLLEQTLQRVICVVPPERTYSLVTRKHALSFSGLSDDVGRLIVQPEDRGTAPAVLYGVLSIRRRSPDANIAIFPANHCVSDEIAFMMRVRSAFRVVERKPDLIVVLGTVPEYPAIDCGWIEPGNPVLDVAETSAFRIDRFWERPVKGLAETLLARGCLWNSQVVVGSADALLLLMQDGAPMLYRAFAPARPMLGTAQENRAIKRVYNTLLKTDFYTEVLASAPQLLAVLPVGESGWSGAANTEAGLELVTSDRRRSGGAGG
jgi:mannose-1-phosphate guanylyltransferase